jgi:hypothetical protein
MNRWKMWSRVENNYQSSMKSLDLEIMSAAVCFFIFFNSFADIQYSGTLKKTIKAIHFANKQFVELTSAFIL